MRAYAVQRFCEPLEILDTADPVPKGSEVVIEVTRCGVCHSGDLAERRRGLGRNAAGSAPQ